MQMRQTILLATALFVCGVAACVGSASAADAVDATVEQPRSVPSKDGRTIPPDAVLSGGTVPGQARLRITAPSGCELNYTAYGCPGYVPPYTPPTTTNPTPSVQCHCHNMVYTDNAYWQTSGRYYNRADCDAEKARRGTKNGRFTCVPDHDPVLKRGTGCFHLMLLGWIEFAQPYSQCIEV